MDTPIFHWQIIQTKMIPKWEGGIPKSGGISKLFLDAFLNKIKPNLDAPNYMPLSELFLEHNKTNNSYSPNFLTSIGNTLLNTFNILQWISFWHLIFGFFYTA